MPTSNTWPFRMVKNGQKLSIRYKNGDYGQKRLIRSKTERKFFFKTVNNGQQRSTAVNTVKNGQKGSKTVKSLATWPNTERNIFCQNFSTDLSQVENLTLHSDYLGH